MDKNAIKKFAVWARRELISRVSQRAAWYGITEKDPIDEKLQAIHGHVLTTEEQAQRRALIAHIRREGYQQVMEEVAYTWFNRFIALRFMEVNGYLPSYTRVFSDDNGAYNPQILKDAIHLDLEGLDMEKVYAMEEANETEALFKYLVITQCNDLNRMLPGMFQKISDYTELLFPDFLLREGSVAHHMVTTIPEEDWKNAVQIIGWLYQYYNAEPKDEVFAALKKNIKISKEKIPAATQLFTPDWIVRYMVENSLGRLWVEGHPNDELKANWKYYLEEAPQEPEVEAQLKQIRAEYAQIDPASILCCDPCMGSGHILVYMFDVLMQIYLAYGYTTNEAVESIVRNNLWGMDIDDRAAQLAYFAVMMKAQQYDHRWLAKQVRHPVQPHVFALQDSGNWSAFEGQMHRAFSNHPSLFEDASIKTAKALFDTFADAKEYGSIIQPDITLEDLDMLEKVLDEMQQQADLMDFVAQADAMTLMKTLKPLILQCRALALKYHVVVTNPPYRGISDVGPVLQEFVQKHYPDSSSDLSTVFMEQCLNMTSALGYLSMINIPVWMTLGCYSELRKTVLENSTVINLLDLGRGMFGSDFGTVSFALMRATMPEYFAFYKRFYERKVEVELEESKQKKFSNGTKDYWAQQKSYVELPGTLFSYASASALTRLFAYPKKLNDYATVFEGLKTRDKDRFLRLWFEISDEKWKKYAKGGAFRRWYGNTDYVVNWGENGDEVRAFKKSSGANFKHYFEPAITYTAMTMSAFTGRYIDGQLFGGGGGGITNSESTLYLLGFVNSCVFNLLISSMKSTVNFEVGQIGSIPVIKQDIDRVESIVNNCVQISKNEWDYYETSWDFSVHPIVHWSRCLSDATAIGATMHYYYGYHPEVHSCVELCYLLWQGECNEWFKKLKANEEELNRIFIDTYGLHDELSPDVDDKDVTVRKADLGRDIRSLISYAVGCMLGRYSLDKPGLAFAGGAWDESQYVTYHADHDGILPITDDEYFDDDVVGMFIDWVRTVYGVETLEANLKFIADALGGKGNPRDVIRLYFLNDFYKDHLKIYQKRPIYWLFDSGKKNGFKCLIYMHRYQPDTIARIRTDYLHETQARYRNAIETLERQSANASTSERVKMTKRLNALKAQAEEARVYEEKIHHLADQMIKIDLDDGVKVNYAKFADVLAPIK